jgi:Ca-activated chloride channel homolog
MIDLATFVDNFHFLRPEWLLIMPFGIGLCVWIIRSNSTIKSWKRIITPDLLPHLIVQETKSTLFRPVIFLALLVILSPIAIAGPAWQRIPTPFVKNNAPLVFAIELTASMQAQDVQPSRLQRALQKIHDLIELKISSQIGLVAYSGSAHIVVPLTGDTNLLKLFAENLKAEIMPLQGDDPAEALQVANSLMAENQIPGTTIFVTDGIEGSFGAEFTKEQPEAIRNFIFYGFGTETGWKSNGTGPAIEGLNLRGINTISNAVNGSVILNSIDKTDLQAIKRKISIYLEGVSPENEDVQWLDAGYYLTWPIALIFLLWARRGWTVRWPQ